MSDLLIHRKVQIDLALQSAVVVFDLLCERKQHGGAELIIEETALDIAAFRDDGARVEADEITHFNAKCAHIIGGFYRLVEHDLGRFKCAQLFTVGAVHVDRRIAKLQGAAVNAGEARVNAAVLRFAVFGAQAADRRDRDAAVRLDCGNHAAERVYVCHQHKRAALAAEAAENAALSCFFRSVAECCQFTDKIVRRFIRKAGRRIDGKQGFELGKAIVHIHVLLLLTKK